MSRDNDNVTSIMHIMINKSSDNKCCLEYKNSFQTEWCRLKSFIMTFSFCMRSACFSAKRFFFFKILLWLIDDELYISWMFIEHEAFIKFDCVFIEFCALFSFCRRNYNVMMFTSLKCHVLCQLLPSMRLLT